MKRREDYAELDSEVVEAGIVRWINGRNGERDRKIMKMYLLDGITYEQMLDRLEEDGYMIGRDRLKQIIKARRMQLFKHM